MKTHSSHNRYSFGFGITKKSIPLLSILLTLFLLQGVMVPFIWAVDLSNYTGGGSGELQCIPPKDTSKCTGTTAFPRTRLMLEEVGKSCERAIEDSGTQAKYGVLVGLLAVPGGLGVAAAYAADEFIEDIFSCVVGGVLTYTGSSEARQALDILVKGKNALAFGTDLTKAPDLSKAEKTWDKGLLLAAKDRGVDIGNTSATLRDPVQINEALNEGVTDIGLVKEALKEAELLIKQCQFDEAKEKHSVTDLLLESYCQTAGRQYRWLEKNIRCLNEQSKNIQTTGHFNWALDPGTVDWESHFKKITMKQREVLDTWGKELQSNLLQQQDLIQQRKSLREKKSEEFDRRKEEYDNLKSSAAQALQQGALKKVCVNINPLKEKEASEGKRSQGCLQRLAHNLKGVLFSAFIDESIDKQVELKIFDVNDLLDEVDTLMTKPECELDKALDKINEAESLRLQIWTYEGSSCQHPSTVEQLGNQIAKKAEELGNVILLNDTAEDLLKNEEKLANNNCTYDQALSEELEDSLNEGCVQEEKERLRRIKAMQKGYAAKADATEQLISSLLEEAIEEITEEDCKINVEAANASITKAQDVFAKHLECNDSGDISPSDMVARRAERIKNLIDVAGREVTRRTSRMQNAKEEYNKLLNRITLRSKDPCQVKNGLSTKEETDLRFFAERSCEPETAENDIRSIKNNFTKIGEKVTKELSTLNSAANNAVQEENCKALLEVYEERKTNTEYLTACKDYASDIKAALQRISATIDKLSCDETEAPLTDMSNAEPGIDSGNSDTDKKKNRVDISSLYAMNFNEATSEAIFLGFSVALAKGSHCDKDTNPMIRYISAPSLQTEGEILTSWSALVGDTLTFNCIIEDTDNEGFGDEANEVIQAEAFEPEMIDPVYGFGDEVDNTEQELNVSALPASSDDNGFGDEITDIDTPPGEEILTYFGRDWMPQSWKTSGSSSQVRVHIFSLGSRLGWAAALGRYANEKAVPLITEHINGASTHVKGVYDNSFMPMKTFKNWKQIQDQHNNWSESLQRRANIMGRERQLRQLSDTLKGQAMDLARRIAYQAGGAGLEQRENCDSYYLRIGYHLAYASQTLNYGAEGKAQGMPKKWIRKITSDGQTAVQTAANYMRDLKNLKLATGYCIDLSDIANTVFQDTRGTATLSQMAFAAQSGWKTTLSALGGSASSVASPGINDCAGQTGIEGMWVGNLNDDGSWWGQGLRLSNAGGGEYAGGSIKKDGSLIPDQWVRVKQIGPGKYLGKSSTDSKQDERILMVLKGDSLIRYHQYWSNLSVEQAHWKTSSYTDFKRYCKGRKEDNSGSDGNNINLHDQEVDELMQGLERSQQMDPGLFGAPGNTINNSGVCEQFKKEFNEHMHYGRLNKAHTVIKKAERNKCEIPLGAYQALQQAQDQERRRQEENRRQQQVQQQQQMINMFDNVIQGIQSMQNQSDQQSTSPAYPSGTTTQQNCRDVCVDERTVWHSSDGRHSLCKGGVPSYPYIKCYQTVQCLKTERRCN